MKNSDVKFRISGHFSVFVHHANIVKHISNIFCLQNDSRSDDSRIVVVELDIKSKVIFRVFEEFLQDKPIDTLFIHCFKTIYSTSLKTLMKDASSVIFCLQSGLLLSLRVNERNQD